MIDYSYVECTSACMTALRAFADAHPAHRAREIARAMERGRRFVLKVGLLGWSQGKGRGEAGAGMRTHVGCVILCNMALCAAHGGHTCRETR